MIFVSPFWIFLVTNQYLTSRCLVFFPLQAFILFAYNNISCRLCGWLLALCCQKCCVSNIIAWLKANFPLNFYLNDDVCVAPIHIFMVIPVWLFMSVWISHDLSAKHLVWKLVWLWVLVFHVSYVGCLLSCIWKVTAVCVSWNVSLYMYCSLIKYDELVFFVLY